LSEQSAALEQVADAADADAVAAMIKRLRRSFIATASTPRWLKISLR
jgi:hypothetical protein